MYCTIQLMQTRASSNLTNRKWFSVVCILINNDILRHRVVKMSWTHVVCVPRVSVGDYQRCGEIFTFFMHALGDKSYWPNSSRKKSTNRIIAMYHSGTASKIQEHVLSSLKDPEGSVRIVIATTAEHMTPCYLGAHNLLPDEALWCKPPYLKQLISFLNYLASKIYLPKHAWQKWRFHHTSDNLLHNSMFLSK